MTTPEPNLQRVDPNVYSSDGPQPVDRAKVAHLRAKIAAGTYPIDPAAIAAALLAAAAKAEK